MTIAAPIVLGADQAWLINAGQTLTVAAVSPAGYTVTIKGGGDVVQTGVWAPRPAASCWTRHSAAR